jgi:hypothetical protein
MMSAESRSRNNLCFSTFLSHVRGALENCEALDAPIPMTPETNPEKLALACGVDQLQPFARPAGDGTYEVVVPVADRSLPLILPYSFCSEEDGELWIVSRKGRKRIERARALLE